MIKKRIKRPVIKLRKPGTKRGVSKAAITLVLTDGTIICGHGTYTARRVDGKAVLSIILVKDIAKVGKIDK